MSMKASRCDASINSKKESQKCNGQSESPTQVSDVIFELDPPPLPRAISLAYHITIVLAELATRQKHQSSTHHILLGMKRLVDYVLSSQIESTETAVDGLMCLAAPMTSCMHQTDNEYIVDDTCDAIANLAMKLGVAFQPFADRVLVALLDMATVPKKDVCDAGMMCRSTTRCVDALTTYTRYSVETLCDYYNKSRASRRRGAKRDLSDLEPYFFLLKGVLHRALHDESLTVRVQSREVFVLFCDLWSDRLTELIYLPSPTIRAVIYNQHADSKIGLALKAKFVKTPPKPTSRRPLPSADYLLDVHLSFLLQFIVLLCTIVMHVYTSIGNVRRRGVFSSSVHAWNPDLQSLATKPQVMTSVGP
ncbi:hypothetical protein AeRB84_008585 [Aphanomyces euteiches]|nr:hypothetical protein AeRB84_008585 [Aphanomyces euteiches]